MSDKIEELVEKLLANTNDGKTKWEEAGLEKGFLTSLSKFSILLGVTQNKIGDNIIELSILNSEGKTIEEYRGQQLTLSSLWNAARRAAFGVEVAIDALIKKSLNNNLSFI